MMNIKPRGFTYETFAADTYLPDEGYRIVRMFVRHHDFLAGTFGARELRPAREIDDKTGWLPVWYAPDGTRVLGTNTGDPEQLWERQISPTPRP